MTAKVAPAREFLSGEDRLALIIREACANPMRGVPVLVGPTQYGKTFFVTKTVLADMLGIAPENIMTMNPQNDLPEDISGWPYRDGAWLKFTQPANIRPDLLDASNYDEQGVPKVKWAILIDEIDKAQEAVLSCFLTLFNPDERRLRHTRISHHVPIIGAMNEPEGRILPDPLLARMLLLPFPTADMHIANRPQFRGVKQIVTELFATMPTVTFPGRPKAPGSVHKLEYWFDVPEFWIDPGVQETVVRGLFPEQAAAVVLAKLKDRTPAPTKQWAMAVTLADLPKQLLHVLNQGTREEMCEVLEILINRCNADQTQEMSEMFVQCFLEAPEVMHQVRRNADAGTEAFVKRVSERARRAQQTAPTFEPVKS